MVMMVIDNGELNGKWLFIGDRKCRMVARLDAADPRAV